MCAEWSLSLCFIFPMMKAAAREMNSRFYPQQCVLAVRPWIYTKNHNNGKYSMEPIFQNGFYKYIPDNWLLVYMWLYHRKSAKLVLFSLLVDEMSSFYTADIFNCAFFATDSVCMWLFHRKLAKFTLSSPLTILNARFLFKLAA